MKCYINYLFVESAILTDELSQIKNINEISLFESLLQGLTSSKVWPKFYLLISALFGMHLFAYLFSDIFLTRIIIRMLYICHKQSQCSEAVVRRCSTKRVFLNISQNSQKNTYDEISWRLDLELY